jgi:excinuclease ABC subunit A
MGPEGGDGGGTIVAQGTPEDVVKVKESYTGRFLKEVLERRPLKKETPKEQARKPNGKKITREAAE